MVAYLRLVLRSVSLVLLCAIVVSFVLSNTARVGIALYPLPFVAELPVYALAVSLLAGGFLLGMMLSSLRHTARHYRLRRALRAEEKKSHALAQQLSAHEIEHQGREHYHAAPAAISRSAASSR